MHLSKCAETDKCPTCVHIVERDWHILSCTKYSYWREQLLCTLGDIFINNHTQLYLALILIQGIGGVLSNQHFQMNSNNSEPIFPPLLVNCQNKIGWQRLLKRRFGNHWTQIQGLHILDDPELDLENESGDQWLKLVLQHLWTLVWQVWLTQNDNLHRCDKDEKEGKRLGSYAHELTNLQG